MFLAIMSIYYVGMSIIFLLTDNPFAALHSGNVGMESDLYSEIFVISPAYVLLGAETVGVLLICLCNKPVTMNATPVVSLAFTILLSGIVNGTIFLKLHSYVYLILSITLTWIIATFDASFGDLKEGSLRAMGWLWAALAAVGFALVLIYPYIYGNVPFEFSRSSRGEVTYWLVLTLHLLAPVACVLAYRVGLPERAFFACAAAFVTIVNLSTMTRAVSMVTLTPYLFILLLPSAKIKGEVRRVIRTAIFFLVALALSLVVTQIVLNGGSDDDRLSMESTLDQRLDLWQFHWNNVVTNPLFGAGPFSLERKSIMIHRSQATSEIGLFVWFSEYGILTGAIVLYFIGRAARRCVNLILNESETGKLRDLFCLMVFVSLFVVAVFEGLSRILDWTSFLFWYCTFYLNINRPATLRSPA
jgi:O-antigen ligase